ncbi:MAG: rod shape-determining protein MreC [Fidelibacterota bacterium]
MRRLLGFLFEAKDFVSLVLAISVSLVLLSSDDSEDILIIRSKVNDILTVLYSPVQWVRDINTLKTENELLRARTVQLKLLNSSLLNYKYENELLHDMLAFKRERHLELIPGRVVSKGMSPILNSITIDIGRQDGIQVNNGVLGIEGIVGKTVLVGERSAVVQILRDYNARVSVKLESSGTTGILRWRSEDTFEVWEIPKVVPVQVGERIITSGYSNIYPENLPVGRVTGVIDRPEILHKIIEAEAFTDFSAIQYVFVVRSLDDE